MPRSIPAWVIAGVVIVGDCERTCPAEARCAEAGIETIYWEAPGTVHGFLNVRKAVPSANDDLKRCIAYLKPWVERAR